MVLNININIEKDNTIKINSKHKNIENANAIKINIKDNEHKISKRLTLSRLI